MYSPQTVDHYEHPRNVGTIKDAEGVGVVGTPASGDMMKLTIKCAGNRIIDAKFRAFGCPAVIAAGSVLTELIRGISIEDALKITEHQLEAALGGLPPDKRRYAAQAEKTLKIAIENIGG
jgi:nitrogen fixation protein NifU and related proteins